MVAHSISKRSLKPTEITPSSQQQALMISIKWTSAQVVKYTATVDSTLFTTTMNISKKYGYSAVSRQCIPVKAGMTFYFVAGQEAGWYYLLQWSENAQRYNCTCPSHTSCKHQQTLANYLDGNYGTSLEAEQEQASDVAPTMSVDVQAVIKAEQAKCQQVWQQHMSASIDAEPGTKEWYRLEKKRVRQANTALNKQRAESQKIIDAAIAAAEPLADGYFNGCPSVQRREHSKTYNNFSRLAEVY